MSGRSSSSDPSGSSRRIVYWTGSTLPTRSCSATKSSISTTSPGVVQGVNGFLGRVALVEPLEDLVVDRLERGDHEQAARPGERRPQLGVAQDVLDLRRA